MEYIEGVNISDFLYLKDVSVFEDIFLQLIRSFNYLEENKILHRDIRESNILIDNKGILKVIDFGFGKRTKFENENIASVILNWPVSEMPYEINNGIYNHQTEIYFIGKLFSKMIYDNEIENFKYQVLLDKMIILDSTKRISSFEKISEIISTNQIHEKEFFDNNDKKIYSKFFDLLEKCLVSYGEEFQMHWDIDLIINKLKELLSNNSLEFYLQNNADLIRCFIKNNVQYKIKKSILISEIQDFYSFLLSLDSKKKAIVIQNIYNRLKNIPVKIMDDDFPF